MLHIGLWVDIQRRRLGGNPIDYLQKTMAEYVAGFADNGELWLGLEEIANMTESGTWEMEVDLVDWSGGVYKASYKDFKVGLPPRLTLR